MLTMLVMLAMLEMQPMLHIGDHIDFLQNCHKFWWFPWIFANFGDKKTQNRKKLLSPELVIFLSLKNSPISSNHRNFHQNWWQKTPKIGRNYCHKNLWHFRHSKTHQFLQFTKNVTKIGEKFGENSIENSNHQNFHQNWWKFWRKFNRKWMWAPTSSCHSALIFIIIIIITLISIIIIIMMIIVIIMMIIIGGRGNM